MTYNVFGGTLSLTQSINCLCVVVPMDLDVRMKATLLGAVFLIVSHSQFTLCLSVCLSVCVCVSVCLFVSYCEVMSACCYHMRLFIY